MSTTDPSTPLTFGHPGARACAPDGTPLAEALARTTHLGIGAHPDDLEIMALPGILACRESPDLWFTGVVCTHGGDSPRAGPYAGCSADAMRRLRRREQEAAARAGGYGLIVQLDYDSADVRGPGRARLAEDLDRLLAPMRPETVYVHAPSDRHATHVAVSLAALAALRRQPPERRPKAVYGGEVWGGLDWLPAGARAALDTSGHEAFCAGLLRLFESQVAGGKAYDQAAAGRRRANATFHDPYAPDTGEERWLAMDLTPLVLETERDVEAFVADGIERFKEETLARIRRVRAEG